MPQYRINDQLFETDTQNLGGFLAERGVLPTTGGVAVALNGIVIPRSQWSVTSIKNGDNLDLVQAKAGG